MMRRLLVGIEHANAGLQDKAAQDVFVARSLAAHCKPGAQFSQHDERQSDFDRLDDGYIAPAKVGVTVGVKRQPHRHISSSTVSCAARALSKAVSLRQLPAMSFRSRCRARSPAT